MKLLKSFPFYILFFSIFPVLSLLGTNISQAHIFVLWRPLLVLLLAAMLIAILLNFLYRNLYRAGIATTLTFFLFFTYGHLYNFLKTVEISGFILGRHRVLVPIWILFLVLSIWWAKKIKNPEKYTQTLNLISAFLLIYPSIQIISYAQSDIQAQKAANAQREEIDAQDLPLGYPPRYLLYYFGCLCKRRHPERRL